MEVVMEDTFALTLFYGNPIESKRKDSWSLLSQIWSTVSGPWMVTGDFNEVFFGWEVDSIRSRNGLAMRRFREVADKCGLMDLGFSGNVYTFSNKRLFPFEFKARLDRVLVNSDWKARFSKAAVVHATAIKSDHCPIVTLLSDSVKHRSVRQFHYEAMWHRHSQFSSVFEGIWSKAHQENSSVTASLKVCANELTLWNKNSFGHVKRRIDVLKTQLDDIRKKDRVVEMVNREKEIISLLDEWQERDEWMWRQHSRIDWLKEGDRNSKFFHAKASQRKKTNLIKSLFDKDGTQVDTQLEISQVVKKYFEDLFESDLSSEETDWDEVLKWIEPKITADMNAKLLEPISNEEIRATLFQMNPSKAPGLDGFPALFFQKH